ncbi:spore germination protein GerPE [Paenibacillus soyae]|uniref:Spore germination protein GerPE n=1 Tax=Paenibacillus soyae TaxID=2969249 RepID=A0A9X2S7C0_9BACL|nr:spore germination protein GerPE [Paenibacillus soyae]MCR2803149.1 spore germination protein GerPE [Paenibacillus soyae]
MSKMTSASFPPRTSQVGVLCIISAASAAAVQLGDRGETRAKLRALAVQRQEDHTESGNVYFESYPLFRRPYPVLRDPVAESGALIETRFENAEPCIRVGCIRIIAAGNASSVQIGNGKLVSGDSRIKHIRQYPKQQPDGQSPDGQDKET